MILCEVIDAIRPYSLESQEAKMYSNYLIIVKIILSYFFFTSDSNGLPSNWPVFIDI